MMSAAEAVATTNANANATNAARCTGDRLSALRRRIQRLADDTFLSGASSPAAYYDNYDEEDCGVDEDHDQDHHHHHQHRFERDDDDQENDIDDEPARQRSLRIGMALFGSSMPSSSRDADEEGYDAALRAQLHFAEKELQDLERVLQKPKQQQPQQRHQDPQGPRGHDQEPEDVDEDEADDPTTLDREARNLRRKLEWLKEIQKVQWAIDASESTYVEFKGAFPTGSHGTSGTSSSTSVSSASSTPSSKALLDRAVQAARQVAQAKQEIQALAEKLDGDDCNDEAEEVKDNQSLFHEVRKMVMTLERSVRRHEADWINAAAVDLWRVELTESRNSYSDDDDANFFGNEGDDTVGGGLAGVTNDDNVTLNLGDDDTTGSVGGRQRRRHRRRSLVARSTPDMLQACYDVYEALAPWRLEHLVRDLLHDLWQPQLQRHRPPNDDQGIIIPLSTWTIQETTLPGRKGKRLEWTMVDVNDAEDATTAMDSPSLRLDRLMGQWKHQLDSYARIMRFCVDHVLVQHPHLVAHAVGPYLWGKPNALPDNLNVHELGIESRRLGDDHGLVLEPLLDSLEVACLPPEEGRGTGASAATTDTNKVLLPTSSTSNAPELLASAEEQLEAMVTPFVESLTDMGLIPDGDSYAKDKLLGLPSQLKQRYVDRCRIRVLDRARIQILTLDFHTTTVVESEPFPASMTGPMGQLTESLEVFRFPKCAVSVTARETVKLCRDTLESATNVARELHNQLEGPGAVLPLSCRPTALWLVSTQPLAMYRSARDALDLFRNLIPARYGTEIASLPRAAAIFHNDCAYLAHQCLTLGLEYKDLFPVLSSSPPSSGTENEAVDDDAREAADATALLRQTCTFVDMVPLFRDRAEKALGTILDLHAHELMEIVQPQIPLLGPSLRSNEILQEWSDAESAFRGALHHLRNLHQAWKPVLATTMLNGSMWYLSDVVLTLFVDQVGTAKDISTSAAQFVSSLFSSISHAVLSLVDHDSSASRVLDRFHAYGKFMDMRLADIEVALSEGLFRSVTGQELTNLITAAFDDSPKRKKLLSQLATPS